MSSFFQKLGFGLKKTSLNLSRGITDIFTKESLSEDVITDLEELLYTADVGVKASSEIIGRFSARRFEKGSDITQIKQELCRDIVDILKVSEQEFIIDRSGKPFVILMVGVNGAGKTTTIGKLALRFQNIGRRIILCAADTFRAAAADQLTVWAERARVPIVKHAEGADPAAVVYDGIQSAKAQGADLLIVDTAGRLHNKKNLMDELNKMRRVIDREFPEADVRCMLVLDATTGQNGLAQARAFKEVCEIGGIILTKLDGTAKGGIALAIRQELEVPVWYIGVGEGIDDLQPFNAKDFVEALF